MRRRSLAMFLTFLAIGVYAQVSNPLLGDPWVIVVNTVETLAGGTSEPQWFGTTSYQIEFGEDSTFRMRQTDGKGNIQGKAVILNEYSLGQYERDPSLSYLMLGDDYYIFIPISQDKILLLYCQGGYAKFDLAKPYFLIRGKEKEKYAFLN